MCECHDASMRKGCKIDTVVSKDYDGVCDREKLWVERVVWEAYEMRMITCVSKIACDSECG